MCHVCVFAHTFSDVTSKCSHRTSLYLVIDMPSAVVFVSILESWFYVPFKKSLIKLVFLLKRMLPVVIDN